MHEETFIRECNATDECLHEDLHSGLTFMETYIHEETFIHEEPYTDSHSWKGTQS